MCGGIYFICIGIYLRSRMKKQRANTFLLMHKYKEEKIYLRSVGGPLMEDSGNFWMAFRPKADVRRVSFSQVRVYMPFEWNSISQSAMNQRTIISIMILVELGLPLLSVRHCLINCVREDNIFCSFCMDVFFDGKETGKEDGMHCRSEEGKKIYFFI